MSTRPRTRQEVVVDISERLNALREVMDAIQPPKRAELIGEDAREELDKYWADAILGGMQEGTITVGDPRLADILHKIARSVMSTVGHQETAKAKFAQWKQEGFEGLSPERFWMAVLDIETIAQDAIRAGLSTPGQDLYAQPRRSSLPGR